MTGFPPPDNGMPFYANDACPAGMHQFPVDELPDPITEEDLDGLFCRGCNAPIRWAWGQAEAERA